MRDASKSATDIIRHLPHSRRLGAWHTLCLLIEA